MNKSTNYIISRTLEEDPVLRIAFERNLMGEGRLAKHIVKLNPQLNLNAESVRTAIRRLKKDPQRIDILGNAQKILAHSYLYVRSNIVKIEFKKDEATLHLINKSFRINEIYNNSIFGLVKGHSVFHAIVEESNLDKILELFEGKIMNIQKNLCEFIIIFPELGKETPGMILSIVNELSMNNVNIVQAFNCGTEVNIIVDEKDNKRTYNLLTNLFERCKIKASS